jgi:hypothetical protein
MAKTKQTIQFKLNLDSNIEEQIQYFKDMSDPGFFELVKENYESQDNMDAVLKMGLKVMDWVYSLWPIDGKAPKRTYNLYKSVKVANSVNNASMGSLALYSDPGVATSWGDSSQTYAAYFIEPEAFNTFIPKAGEQDWPRNFRPFFERWELLFDKLHCKFAERALRETLKALKPA